MLEHLHYLSYPKPKITQEHFNRWKNDPCTLELKKALVTAFLQDLSDPLPANFDGTVIGAHQREGAMSVVDQLIHWTPEIVDPEAVDA
jgi:hypothetical protein